MKRSQLLGGAATCSQFRLHQELYHLRWCGTTCDSMQLAQSLRKVIGSRWATDSDRDRRQRTGPTSVNAAVCAGYQGFTRAEMRYVVQSNGGAMVCSPLLRQNVLTSRSISSALTGFSTTPYRCNSVANSRARGCAEVSTTGTSLIAGSAA